MRQDPTLTVDVSTTITKLQETEWDRLVPPSPERYQFFKTVEETLAGQFTFYYVAIREHTRLLCLAPCFIMEYPLETTVTGPLKVLLSSVKKISPRFLTMRVLLCGSPTGEARLGIAEVDRSDVAHALVRTLHTIAKRERVRLLAFKDVAEHYGPFFEPLLKYGFRRIPSYPSASLNLQFESFEAYLSSLSRATRKDLKRKFHKVDGHIRIEMEVRAALGEMLDEAYQLYLNTFEKGRTHFELVSKEFFERIAHHMPEATKFFLWRIDGRLVAFDLCLVDGSILHDEYLGMDYDIAYQYHLYYVTFRDIVRWGLQHGVRRYSTGALNYDPKKRLDFTFTPLYIYLKHTHPVMNRLFHVVSAVLKPENFDPMLKSVYPGTPR